VPTGLDIFRVPSFDEPFLGFVVEILPLTIIAYMESYAVARKLAQQYGYLSTLNPSQELWALGLGNIIGCVTSAYPVSGSFSRSALNASIGARTPFASLVTVLVVCVTVASVSTAFYWIPKAALAAIIMAAVLNLIEVEELWHAWKVSKKDFWVMLSTFCFTLTFSSELGLAVGLGLSIVLLLKDLAFALEAEPVSHCMESSGVQVIRLNSNLVFISATRIKEVLLAHLLSPKVEGKDSDICELSVVVIDFVDVKHVDLSGLLAMRDVMLEAKSRGIAFVTVNVLPNIQRQVNTFRVH
jgi:SulP family sulfate permease